ncbi:MAG: hypothetical protein LBD59_11495 [Prevotellaceae bacterium]|jgi:hypothetical protein|nr:hypothetical protein [Prevotellaceae bacterium]
MRIYGYVTGCFDEGGDIGGGVGARRALPLQSQSQSQSQPLTIGDF